MIPVYIDKSKTSRDLDTSLFTSIGSSDPCLNSEVLSLSYNLQRRNNTSEYLHFLMKQSKIREWLGGILKVFTVHKVKWNLIA